MLKQIRTSIEKSVSDILYMCMMREGIKEKQQKRSNDGWTGRRS